MSRWPRTSHVSLAAGALCAVALTQLPELARGNETRVDLVALPPAEQADAIVVEKGARRMTLLREGRVLRSYRVSLGPSPVGHKVQEGDGRTPEGRYTISGRNPRSSYHLSLRVSYPNEADTARARAKGLDPGGDIMIHGLPNGLGWMGSKHRLNDWTAGCIAVTNDEIAEIWRLVPNGTPIDIRP